MKKVEIKLEYYNMFLVSNFMTIYAKKIVYIFLAWP